MWKLIFFVILNGQPHLGLIDVDGPTQCRAKAQEMITMAEQEKVTLAVNCVFIKIA